MIRRVYEKLVASLVFIRGEADFEKARMLVPFFYYALFFVSFIHLEGLDYAIERGDTGFAPLWPLFWGSYFPFETTTTLALLAPVLTALVACVVPFSRLARIAAFLGFFFYHAYLSSFGGPNHQWDHWLFVAFILIFLPRLRGEPSSATRKSFSLVFWTAQVYLLLTYTMAGIGKLIYAAIQLAAGQPHAFSPDAGALFTATQLNQMGISTPLGPLLIEHPYLAWLPFLIMLELQTFAIVAAFRPQLHRAWGLGLILFHLGTFLTMRAVFVAPTLLLALFLLSSPFAPAKADVRETVFSVPILGAIARFVHRRIAARSR
jgi:hypothetical protein